MRKGIVVLLVFFLAASAFAATGKVKIDFFQQKEPAAVDPFNAVIAAFMKKNPNIQIEQTYVPDAPQIFQTRVAANDVPDLFTHWPERITYWELCKQGIMMDLTDQPFMTKVDAPILDRGRYQGKVYCLPVALLTFGVIYNVDMYAKYNIKVPTTWTEFIKVLELFKAVKTPGIILELQFAETIGQKMNSMYKMAMGNAGADKFFADLAYGRTTFAQNPAAQEAVAKFLKLTDYMQPGAAGTGTNEMVSDFAAGKGAHLYAGTWNFGGIKGKAAPDFKYAMYPFPMYDDVAKNTSAVGIDMALCIGKNTKYKDELITFLKFVADDEGAKIYCDGMNNQPAIKGVPSNIPQLVEMNKAISAGRTFRLPHHFWKAGLDKQIAIELVNMILDGKKDTAKYYKAVETIFKTEGPTEFQK